MPNTLAHFGVQAAGWKLADPGTDIKWLALGCVIPDLPWIVQRLAPLAFELDPILLRLYCLIQASLFFCLILSLALALTSNAPRRLFAVLAASSLLHLLLDALQTKWANGSHLLAPLNWQLSSWQLFWPESPVTLVMTGAGLAAICWFGWRDRRRNPGLEFHRRRLSGAVILLGCYLLLPPLFFYGPLEADNHYLQTLREQEVRPGRQIALDRCRYDQLRQEITIFTGERFRLLGTLPEQSGTISLLGTFVGKHAILVRQLHQHGSSRDLFSVAGLLLLAWCWLIPALYANPAGAEPPGRRHLSPPGNTF